MPLAEDKEIELKKTGLTYLYYYHENYKTASVEEKRKIRKYYDEKLRYKNAFYRDRKQFDKFGHPSDWEERKIKRFTIEKEMKKYQEGRQIFVKPFEYISNNLIKINISKQVNIELVKIIDEVIDINLRFSDTIKKEINVLKYLMQQIDNSKNTILIKDGYIDTQFCNLGNLQVVFKLQINTIVRYISTKYQSSKLIGENAVNRLELFLRTITGLEKALVDETTQQIRPSNIFPDDFEITNVTLIQIELNKVTNLFSHLEKSYRDGDYFIETKVLKTKEVKQR